MKLHKILLTVFLLASVVLLIVLNLEKEEKFGIERPNNVVFDKSNNILDFSSLTLKQKISQMIIVFGTEDNDEFYQNMLIGGFHLGARESKEEFVEAINHFQDESIIPFFVTIDMEGCNNPLEKIQGFPSSDEIETLEEAYHVGDAQGKLLKELGFSVSFSPVVDLEDMIWKCRSFLGTPEEISEKAVFYIAGLQDNGVIATSKHFPGQTLSTKDPHLKIAHAAVNHYDLLPFETTIENNVSAVMVSHLIIDGVLSSDLKPATVSMDISERLRSRFSGLIITDEIGMLGLKDYYDDFNELYLDLFKADNDLIIYFNSNTDQLYGMVARVEKAVLDGEISEERIDTSVKRILKAKGITIV